jgi:hypothetical protein
MKRNIFLGLLALLALALSFAGCYAQSSPVLASLEGSAIANESQNEPLNTSGALSLSDLKEMQLYENAEYGFSMSYPSAWIVQEADPNEERIVVGFLAPGEDLNNSAIYIYVQVEDMASDQKVTLEQYNQAVLSNLKSVVPNFLVLAESDISIGGQPGHAIAYNLNSEGIVFRVFQAWTIYGERAYIITYNAPLDSYEAFSGDASKIIGSLKAT